MQSILAESTLSFPLLVQLYGLLRRPAVDNVSKVVKHRFGVLLTISRISLPEKNVHSRGVNLGAAIDSISFDLPS